MATIAADITSANAQLSLAVNGLFGATSVEQFSMEDIFTTQPAEASEVMMGVDGVLSAGYIYTPKKMEIALMANSPSTVLFDLWYQTMTSQIQVFSASGTIAIPSLGYNYVMFNGFLTRYSPTSDARRVMQPRRFEITWNSITSVQVVTNPFANSPGSGLFQFPLG